MAFSQIIWLWQRFKQQWLFRRDVSSSLPILGAVVFINADIFMLKAMEQCPITITTLNIGLAVCFYADRVPGIHFRLLSRSWRAHQIPCWACLENPFLQPQSILELATHSWAFICAATILPITMNQLLLYFIVSTVSLQFLLRFYSNIIVFKYTSATKLATAPHRQTCYHYDKKTVKQLAGYYIELHLKKYLLKIITKCAKLHSCIPAWSSDPIKNNS